MDTVEDCEEDLVDRDKDPSPAKQLRESSKEMVDWCAWVSLEEVRFPRLWRNE
jgi:hypothetical protein